MSKPNEITLSDLKSSKLTDERIRLGLIPFDAIISGGFETTGTIVQLVSASGLGKSTLACQISEKMCEFGTNVLYIDSEGSISTDILYSTGLLQYLDKSFFIVRESTFTSIEKTIDLYLSTGEIGFIVVDSLSAIMHDGFGNLSQNKGKSTDSKEKNSAISISTNNSNYNSRQLTLFLNKYAMLAKQRGISILYTNQFRTRITNLFNYAEEKIGGSKNVKYSSDIIVKISDNISKQNKDFTSYINRTDFEHIGKDLEFEIIKSNKARTGKKIPFRFDYGFGINKFFSVTYPLFKKGILVNNKGNYVYTPYDEEKGEFLEDFKETYKGFKNLYDNCEYLAISSAESIEKFYANII